LVAIWTYHRRHPHCISHLGLRCLQASCSRPAKNGNGILTDKAQRNSKPELALQPPGIMTLGGELLKYQRRTTERKPALVQLAFHLPAELDMKPSPST